MKFVLPETYWLGETVINNSEMDRYLRDTDQMEFLNEINTARDRGLSDGEILCSFYAKACYRALTTKHNKNITRVRDIYDNIAGTIASNHGSVFEHCFLNFTTNNCSRIYTHELVRHRAGTAFSQTSGRYVRNDELYFVHDPILDDVQDDIKDALSYIEEKYKAIEEKLGINNMKNFAHKKKLTSAMRRILPNGQANEIGFSVNLRALRHTITMRTSEHAEWEIRVIFNQIFDLIFDKYRAIFHDAIFEMKDGIREITFANEKI